MIIASAIKQKRERNIIPAPVLSSHPTLRKKFKLRRSNLKYYFALTCGRNLSSRQYALTYQYVHVDSKALHDELYRGEQL